MTELASGASGFSDPYLSRTIKSTITKTVPREIGRNITDLVQTLAEGALELVWRKVAADESKGHSWAGSSSDSIPISILTLYDTSTVPRKAIRMPR